MDKLGYVGQLSGQIISLNQKKATYFGIGKLNKIGNPEVWLAPNHWYAELPAELSAQDQDILYKALEKGLIKMGKHWMPALVKDTNVKEKYIQLMIGRKLFENTKQPFIDLVKKEKEGNYTALEILSYCLKKEQEGSNRQEWIAFLKDGMAAYRGPVQLVEDTPDEAYEVQIDFVEGTIKPVGEKEVSSRSRKSQPKGALKKREKELTKGKDTTARKKAIENALE